MHKVRTGTDNHRPAQTSKTRLLDTYLLFFCPETANTLDLRALNMVLCSILDAGRTWVIIFRYFTDFSGRFVSFKLVIQKLN